MDNFEEHKKYLELVEQRQSSLNINVNDVLISLVKRIPKEERTEIENLLIAKHENAERKIEKIKKSKNIKELEIAVE